MDDTLNGAIVHIGDCVTVLLHYSVDWPHFRREKQTIGSIILLHSILLHCRYSFIEFFWHFPSNFVRLILTAFVLHCSLFHLLPDHPIFALQVHKRGKKISGCAIRFERHHKWCLIMFDDITHDIRSRCRFFRKFDSIYETA